MKIFEGIIFVRYYGGTYIARYQGKSASCTAGPKQAAERVARKVIGDNCVVKEYGNKGYAWQVLKEVS